ncbi:protein FAR1-related sequence 5-like, partial [Trifolium pratense]
MNGKHPLSVITDGDLAMRNAIRRVFPTSHHRLCAWHLLRNASSNIGIPECMSHLKRCMLGDMEVEKFENLWSEMVEKFRLQDNNWVKDMYEKRKMWATAHIRGSFFAGIRTTSRCEALHSHIGQFLHSRINMTDFVQQFHRCLTFFRFREIEADFQSNYGEPVLQTSMRSIEKSAAKQFTKEIFLLFRSILKNAVLLRITGSVELSMGYIFNVSKYCGDGSEWYVTFCEEPIDFKCSCLRMESLGLPCDHILATMLYLDFDQLPECLVLPRWSKYAKDSIRDTYASGSLYWDAQPAARFSAIVQMCKVAAELVFNDLEEYN